MSFIDLEIIDYIEKYSSDEPEILAALRRETWQKVVNPRMLSGAYQGRLLSLLSKLIRPKLILEIGTFTGYSTICLAEGLQKDGIIYTIDKNEELIDIQNKYFLKSDKYQQIKPILGDALTIIPQICNDLDLVFIDADKSNYLNYLNLVMPKIRQGGVIITDNVLWNGKVLQNIENEDNDTKIIRNYNQTIKSDIRLETLILPIRDGVSIVIKK